eukprot:14496545-Alexandrium_andersonii.AAC.1
MFGVHAKDAKEDAECTPSGPSQAYIEEASGATQFKPRALAASSHFWLGGLQIQAHCDTD